MYAIDKESTRKMKDVTATVLIVTVMLSLVFLSFI